MDPFNIESNSNTEIIDDKVITIKVEKRGRKTNTYIYDWEIPEDKLKEHLKTFKKTLGCNGSLKKTKSESLYLHLQGDHSDFVSDYLQKHDIKKNNINYIC